MTSDEHRAAAEELVLAIRSPDLRAVVHALLALLGANDKPKEGKPGDDELALALTNMQMTIRLGLWEMESDDGKAMAGNYVQACNALLKYRYAAGFDCSTPGNKRCWGVWTRQLERHAKCMAAQQ